VAHRYKKGSEFENPSIYCYDLMKLITHVQNRVLRHLSKHTIEMANLAPVTYQSAVRSITKFIST
jgi:uncharacterized protein